MPTKLELERLKEFHPRLPIKTALEYVHRAALGLQRHQHISGVNFKPQCDGTEVDSTLHWSKSSKLDQPMLDHNRITEDAAEAISLTLAYVHFGWVLRRRLQKGESGDWLLQDKDKQLIALEVSGMDQPDGGIRLRQKMDQIRRTFAAPKKAVCVVELAPPHATMRQV